MHAAAAEVADGRSLARERFAGTDGDAVAIVDRGDLLAVYRATPGCLAAEVVLPTGAAA